MIWQILTSKLSYWASVWPIFCCCIHHAHACAICCWTERFYDSCDSHFVFQSCNSHLQLLLCSFCPLILALNLTHRPLLLSEYWAYQLSDMYCCNRHSQILDSQPDHWQKVCPQKNLLFKWSMLSCCIHCNCLVMRAYCLCLNS